MITNFFIPELNIHDVQELWFQQDGATCHTARATIDLLKDTFGDRLISRFGPVNWPPRSCDLTPLDYFLWGYVKSLVYADKPQTLDHLKDNIHRVIADIRPQMLEKVIENWTSRLDYIRASRGSPMPEIIFKILGITTTSSKDDYRYSSLVIVPVAAVAKWYRYRTVACFVTGSSPVPLKTRRVGQRCTFNLSRAEKSSRWQWGVFAVEAYFSNGRSVVVAQRVFLHYFDIPPRSSVPPYGKCVLMWMDAFRATGNVSKERKGPPKTVRTPENVE
ncbi:uncharacterized protein TNCV_27341 [Trichonephila clavipes]|uniref:Transposase n=1 Tax=Trichonephila clavipes TaxID=2585209 RepID=A0A8X7BMG8_TRICX|nr:uncharacterized protein TNCV_27341 [Trichonephila clavipes]